ncbi:MAG: hypothetical protein SFW64_09260 [Alphaproteobacteria bacterium]|nr:hypothetical protein [Alphaproteobacteria bacterium]
MDSNVTARSVLFSTALLLVAACMPPADSAYRNRGTPEALIDISSEVVSLPVGDALAVADLKNWLNRDRPTRAELNCVSSDKYCGEAKKLFEKQNIPLAHGTPGNQTVTLIYERILARDCNPSYVDNPHNFYNTNHAAFGCAVSANMVQHVTNKQEFVNPALSDDPSAVRGVNDIRRAYTPQPPTVPYTVGDSLVSKGKTESE